MRDPDIPVEHYDVEWNWAAVYPLSWFPRPEGVHALDWRTPLAVLDNWSQASLVVEALGEEEFGATRCWYSHRWDRQITDENALEALTRLVGREWAEAFMAARHGGHPTPQGRWDALAALPPRPKIAGVDGA